MTSVLERFGARVATAQDDALSVEPLPSTDDVLAGIGRRRRAHTRSRALVTSTSALLVAAGLLLGWRGLARTESHPGFEPPSLGVAHAESTNVPLVFEDGTKIVVQRGAQAELREIRRHGAELHLESGTLNVDVVHTAESRWDVKAGPFGIRVTGTRFDATYDARTKALTVAMAEGTVMVTGPCVNEPLSAPSRKVFACAEALPSASGPTPSEAPVPSISGEPASTPTAAVPPPRPRWKANIEQGQYEAAVSSMTPSELDVAMAREPASSLLGLADAARLSGDTARATQLYSKIRMRFPRSEPAAKAAFLLGRMADASGARDEAARWFETVTQEAPNAFAQEALGRLVELEQNRGRRDRAHTLALEYLAKYPHGAYQAYASSVAAAATPR